MGSKEYLLREIQQEDITFIYTGLSDPRVTKHYAVSFPTLEATQEQMDWYAGLKESGTGKWWGIFLRETGEFCGAGGFNDLKNGTAEVGFWLLPKFWGLGILQRILPLLFDEGFRNLGLERIEGFVESTNHRCKNALNKIHFKYEKTLKNYEEKDGKSIDVDLYAVHKGDWHTNSIEPMGS